MSNMDHSRSTSPQQASRHPRRPPAHQSVSLRHDNSSSRPSPTPASDQANPPSTVSPKLYSNKQSSGEDSDAGKWYEKANKNAVQSNATFLDNDLPFFLRNSSSSGTPPEGHEHRTTYTHPHSTILPHRPGNTRCDTDDSSTQDFRSVIDDLTVANKKLKQKLRKYEKLYDAHLQDEKLFEVRFHGLPDHKKKELEEHLQKFAANLDRGPNTGYPSISYALPLVHQESTYSHTSRVAESGYASMSATGQNSMSTPMVPNNDRHKMSKSQYSQQQQSIRSYLYDIPAGLLPKRNASMTEKSKKKLVVRRLEQIFAGKQSAPGSHPHPMQQEEVAQSAARADRRAIEATGRQSKLEGLREARIMTSQSEGDEHALFAPSEALPNPSLGLYVNDQDLNGSGSPDQRPTRPLDLDPYRAQVPAENIQYIRHLGFTPPDMISGEAPEEGHGWLYLNLLIGMAQLHTINVTPDFVKEAVSEFSSKFELSHDGRKIRWRGGQDVTMGSSDSSPEQLGDSPNGVRADMISMSPNKRHKSGIGEESGKSMLAIEQNARRVSRAMMMKEQGKFAYTPLFFHKDDSEEEDDLYNLDDSSPHMSPFPAQPRGDSSGFVSSAALQSSSSRKQHNDGPMIFYNNAKFCTDLSGDRRGYSVDNHITYRSVPFQALGDTPKIQPIERNAIDISEPRGPLDDALTEIDSKQGERFSSSEEEISFIPAPLRNDTSSESVNIMDFEASGLGGVQSEDNFNIKVRRSQVQTAPSSSACAPWHKPHRYPKNILEALKEKPLVNNELPHKHANVIREEIISTSRKIMPSSVLPPASFFPFDSNSSCDVDDSESESDVSSRPSSSDSADDQPDPPIAPQLLNVAAPTLIGPSYTVAPGNEGSIESSYEESSDDDSDDDVSVDFLATARKLDPKTVLASEREYDAAVADRLAEEIPTGSSAATAGGGSGFNTPQEMAVIEEEINSVDSAMGSIDWEIKSGSSRTKSLKRVRSHDSMETSLRKQKIKG